jgi:hypothetical protein
MTLEKNRSIQIKNQYCGPPTSANGGICCGFLAKGLSGDVEVTLKMPPPLDTDLEIISNRDGASIYWNDQEVATAKQTTLELEVPVKATLQQALTASGRFVPIEKHIFPNCFVCGPQRKEGDGLRIFAGPVDFHSHVAAPWIPDSTLGDSEGNVASEFIWAALDCPGYFGLKQKGMKALLGRMTASIIKAPPIMRKTVVVAWKIESDGRKHSAGTALFDSDGELYAKAKQVWIEID